MNHENDAVDQLLGRIDQTDPPESLRAQTLSIALQTMRESANNEDLWTRIWKSRRLRLAWVAAVMALVSANLMLPHFQRKQQTENAIGNRMEMEELGDAVRVPRLRFSYVQPLIGAPSPTESKKQKEKL
jgi:hypothetical protein